MIGKHLSATIGTLVKYDDRGFFELVDGLAIEQVSGGLRVDGHNNVDCQNVSQYDQANYYCTGSSGDYSSNTVCTGMQHPAQHVNAMYDTICIGPGDSNTVCKGGNPWSGNTGCVMPQPTGYSIQDNTACLFVPAGGYHSDTGCVTNPSCGTNAPC